MLLCQCPLLLADLLSTLVELMPNALVERLPVISSYTSNSFLVRSNWVVRYA